MPRSPSSPICLPARHRVQLTTDGHKAYLGRPWKTAFGGEIDYAMLIKLYGRSPARATPATAPASAPGRQTHDRQRKPDAAHFSTSYVERQNLTMRMRMRRFTRLTNAFSKKLANLEHAIALHYMHYNFVRRHQTLRVTPAMAAGVERRVWSIEDIVGLID